MAQTSRRSTISAVVLLSLGLPVTAGATTWPDEADWEPLLSGGAPLVDPCGDISGNAWWDIVGDADNPAAFVYDDGTNLWFRMRIASAP